MAYNIDMIPFTRQLRAFDPGIRGRSYMLCGLNKPESFFFYVTGCVNVAFYRLTAERACKDPFFQRTAAKYIAAK